MASYDPSPRSTHYEFLGPPGAFLISLLVPTFTYLFALLCNERGCPPFPLFNGIEADWKELKSGVWDAKAYGVYVGWYFWTVICWKVIPGEWCEGVLLRDGKRKLNYKINAFGTFVVTIAIALLVYLGYGHSPFLFISDHWYGLLTAAYLNSLIQAIYVYAMSFVSSNPARELALGGNTGSTIYDFFIGRELNPRIGNFDIKSFNELRPGLILWVVLDLGMVARQMESFGNVSDSMWVVLGCQTLYVADALWNERAIFTTMDITTDGFGFMLSVGDLLWVPFTYGLQARFLSTHFKTLGPLVTLLILGVNFTGYYIFRISNGQKNDFRNGKIGNLKFMETSSGRRLITSGWWGRSRHPNYLGDLIMGLAWSLPTGFENPLTYFYFFYFLVLLVHRQRRDDENCHKKYGKDWDKYIEKVPWRICPGVY